MRKYCDWCEKDVIAILDNRWVICPICEDLLMCSRTTEPEKY